MQDHLAGSCQGIYVLLRLLRLDDLQLVEVHSIQVQGLRLGLLDLRPGLQLGNLLVGDRNRFLRVSLLRLRSGRGRRRARRFGREHFLGRRLVARDGDGRGGGDHGRLDRALRVGPVAPGLAVDVQDGKERKRAEDRGVERDRAQGRAAERFVF